MKLDFLFHRQSSANNRRDRKDPQVAAPISFSEHPLSRIDGEAEEIPRLALPSPHFGVRQMSPRQLAVWAHEMYLSGALNWQEYCFAGFHAELHPNYNATVGALTGHRAAPDRPRDMIREWEDRLAFYCRHNKPQDPQVKRVEKVLALLCGPAVRQSVESKRA